MSQISFLKYHLTDTVLKRRNMNAKEEEEEEEEEEPTFLKYHFSIITSLILSPPP